MSTNVSSAKGSPGAIPAALGGLYERRWLAYYFLQRQISRNYRRSFLGIAWLILGPLLMVILYTLVFSEVIGLRFRENESVANFGLYLYCGLLPFQTFSEAMSKGVNSIRSNTGLVQKVVFPLEILPLSTTVTAFSNMFFGFGALVILVVLLEGQLQWTMLLLPMILVPHALFILGVSCLMAVAGTYLPDIREGIQALVRVLFFATPIIWPVDRVADNPTLKLIVDYNPLAFLVEAYRNLVLDGVLPGMTALLYFTLFAAAICVGGFVTFVFTKKRFADLI